MRRSATAEKRREYMARHYAKHPEALKRDREARKRWREAHREKCREYQRRHAAKRRAEREREREAAERRERRRLEKNARNREAYRRLVATPEGRERVRAANAARREKMRLERPEQYKAMRRRQNEARMRNFRAHEHDIMRKREYRRRNAAHLYAKQCEWYARNPHYQRDYSRAHRTDEFKSRENARARELRRERKTLPLKRLDLEALALFLKRGVQPAWKRRVDHGSRYCPDALIGKAGGMEAEDIRAAELRGYGFELAIERKQRREAAGRTA